MQLATKEMKRYQGVAPSSSSSSSTYSVRYETDSVTSIVASFLSCKVRRMVDATSDEICGGVQGFSEPVTTCSAVLEGKKKRIRKDNSVVVDARLGPSKET